MAVVSGDVVVKYGVANYEPRKSSAAPVGAAAARALPRPDPAGPGRRDATADVTPLYCILLLGWPAWPYCVLYVLYCILY